MFKNPNQNEKNTSIKDTTVHVSLQNGTNSASLGILSENRLLL